MASRLNEQIDRRLALKAEGESILAIAATKRTPAQTQRLDAIEVEVGTVDRAIAQLRTAQADEIAAASGPAADNLVTLVRPSGRRYAQLFGEQPASPFRGFDEFVNIIHAGLNDPRLQATATIGIPSEGGFSVPDEHTAALFDASLHLEAIRPRAQVWAMRGSSIKAPAWEASTDTTLGGWTAEAAEIAPSTPQLRAIELRAKKLAVLTELSAELAADGLGYAEQLQRRFVSAIGRHLDRGFLRGAGAEGPLGILNSPALITVAKETNQADGSIVYSNLARMYSRLPAASMRQATWIVSPTCIPQLLQLSVPIGTAGSHVQVMNEVNGKFTIFGLEVVVTDIAPALGDAGDVLLADLSAYIIGQRQGLELAQSAHAGFSRATTYFRALLRADGAPGLSAPIAREYGGDTESPFVALGARS
jgi:HK97 family phage major capsid protein